MIASGIEIGQGAEAFVTVVKMADSPELVAIKTAKSPDFHANLRKEGEILALFNHPNIVRVKKPYELVDSTNVGQGSPTASLGLELSMEGSIFEYIFATKQGLPKRIAKYYLLQLLDGLEALQDNHIVHQDLKPENFLVFDGGKVIKIADFGMFADLNPVLERENSQESPKARINGTYTYMAPECLGGNKSFQSDIFSLMVSAFVLVHGFLPFGSAKVTDKMYKLIALNNDVEYTKAIKKIAGCVDTVFLDLFLKAVKYQPSKRITLDQVKDHPWLADDIGSQSEAVEYIQSHFQQVRTEFISQIQSL